MYGIIIYLFARYGEDFLWERIMFKFYESLIFELIIIVSYTEKLIIVIKSQSWKVEVVVCFIKVI